MTNLDLILMAPAGGQGGSKLIFIFDYDGVNDRNFLLFYDPPSGKTSERIG
jgi:hypothetical protein